MVDRPGIIIHIYDHHPFTDEDVHGEFEHVEKLGVRICAVLTACDFSADDAESNVAFIRPPALEALDGELRRWQELIEQEQVGRLRERLFRLVRASARAGTTPREA